MESIGLSSFLSDDYCIYDSNWPLGSDFDYFRRPKFEFSYTSRDSFSQRDSFRRKITRLYPTLLKFSEAFSCRLMLTSFLKYQIPKYIRTYCTSCIENEFSQDIFFDPEKDYNQSSIFALNNIHQNKIIKFLRVLLASRESIEIFNEELRISQKVY